MGETLFPWMPHFPLSFQVPDRRLPLGGAAWPVRISGDGIGAWMETSRGRYRIVSEEWLAAGMRLGLLGARFAQDGV